MANRILTTHVGSLVRPPHIVEMVRAIDEKKPLPPGAFDNALTGAVAEVSLVRASPRGMGFEDAATRYVRTRVYRPATKQGVPVRVWLPIVVEFQHPGR